MLHLLTTAFLSLILVLVIFTTTRSLPIVSSFNREKNTPFECGFEPIKSARLPFSLRFFLLAVIFLIFDVEIALLLPFPIALNFSFNLISLFIFSQFLLILLLGLVHEWFQGALDWNN